MTDTDGRIVWSARYRAYGNLALADIEAIDNPLRFQGQYFDQETGLHYNLNRYYDPNAGRFIHQDPIGLAGGNNLYQYAPNPVNWIDPWGLTGKDCAGGANAGGYSNYSDEQFITEIARRSEQKVGGTGAVAGTHKHTYAEKLMNRYQRMTGQRQNLVTEQSYLGGVQVPRGTPGSSRPDVYDPVTGDVFDYKFTINPGRGIPTRQLNRNLNNLPNVTRQTEINP